MATTKENTEIKEIKAMLSELIEKNNKLTEENEKLRAKVPVRKLSKEDEEAREWLEEKVPLYLFKDSGKYKDDVVVSVNGKNWRIQRGVEVEVPRYVYNIIRQSEYQRDLIDTRIEALETAFENKSKNI